MGSRRRLDLRLRLADLATGVRFGRGPARHRLRLAPVAGDALVQGGSCRGLAYRVDAGRVEEELRRLWAREMPNGIYDPKWLPCRTPQGVVRALAFTLDRKSPSHTGRVDDEQMVEILRTANGRFGSTLAYLVETATSLRDCGIRDRDIERLVELARRNALTA
jgi:cation transport protein ChaC